MSKRKYEILPLVGKIHGLSLLAILLFLLSCAPVENVTSMQAYDNTGQRLGYVLSAGSYSLSIQTEKDYIYNLGWAGSIVSAGTFYFTEADGKGTAFLQVHTSPYSKSVFPWHDGTLRTYHDIDPKGFAAADPSITHYRSYYKKKITNWNKSGDPTPIAQGNKAYRVKPITRAEAGIPAAIAVPIQIRH